MVKEIEPRMDTDKHGWETAVANGAQASARFNAAIPKHREAA
jgi:hypothetical protein